MMRRVTNEPCLREIVKTPVGNTVNMVVRRDANDLTLPVTVAEWPRSTRDQRDAPLPADRPNSTILPDLGLSFVAIPTSKRASLGLEDMEGGVLVAGVAPRLRCRTLGHDGWRHHPEREQRCDGFPPDDALDSDQC